MYCAMCSSALTIELCLSFELWHREKGDWKQFKLTPHWFILYCLRFMNYCKSDGVSHNTATGFLNQADRLIIELQQRRQRSMEEWTIPDPGGENITQHSLVVRGCCTRSVLKQLPWLSPSLIATKQHWYRASYTVDQSRQQHYCLTWQSSMYT